MSKARDLVAARSARRRTRAAKRLTTRGDGSMTGSSPRPATCCAFSRPPRWGGITGVTSSPTTSSAGSTTPATSPRKGFRNRYPSAFLPQHTPRQPWRIHTRSGLRTRRRVAGSPPRRQRRRLRRRRDCDLWCRSSARLSHGMGRAGHRDGARHRQQAPAGPPQQRRRPVTQRTSNICRTPATMAACQVHSASARPKTTNASCARLRGQARARRTPCDERCGSWITIGG